MTTANAWDLQCYGCSESSLRKLISTQRNPITFVACLLSDAQEEIEMGMSEQARQTLNRAKFCLFNYVEETTT
jgi:uncharacterized cysteine cluster protein YcgN (CxxCxxCC family)